MKSRCPLKLILALVSLFITLASVADAATRTWDGSASGYWTNAANWTANIVPTNGDALVFAPNASRFLTTNSPGAATNFTSLHFTGSNYVLFSRGLSLTNGMTNAPAIGSNTIFAPLTTRANQTWLLSGRTILSLYGNLTLSTFGLTMDGPGEMQVFSNVVGSAGSSVVQNGKGKVTLKGTANSVLDWRVGNGELAVEGALSGGLIISNGAVLSGTGKVPQFFSAGSVRPGGTSPGVLSVAAGITTFAAGSTLQVNLKGTTPGSGYDQLSIITPPNLSGATLSVVVSGFTPVPGDTFIIITNTGGAAFFSTFSGRPEGSAFTVGATRFVISYVGGDGNDVTLRVVPASLFNGSLDLCHAVEIVPGFFLPKPLGWQNVGTRSISGPYEEELSSEPWAGPAPTPVTTDGSANPPSPEGCGGDDCAVFFKPFTGNGANGSATGHLYQDVAATPGTTYALIGWAGAEANALLQAEFKLEFFDVLNNLLASSARNLVASGLFVPNGQPFNYKQYTVVATAPANSAIVRVRASMMGGTSNPMGGGQAFVVDDFSLLNANTPLIISQPKSRTNYIGTTATFSVGAVGAGSLSYRWRKNGVDLFDSTYVSGAATSTLTLSNVLLIDAANYSVLVSNPPGSGASAPATLTVILTPTTNLLANPHLDFCQSVEIVPGFFLPKPASWQNVGTRTISGPYEDEMSSEPWAGPAPTPVTVFGNANPPPPEGCGGPDCAVFFKPFSGGGTDGPATGHLYQDVPGAPGVIYTLTGWAGAEANALMTRAEFAVEFFDAGNNMVGGAPFNLSTNGLFVPNGQPFNYKQYTVAAIAPPDTAFVRARASMIGATSNPMGGGQAFVVDDFSLTVQSLVQPRITSISIMPGGAKRIRAQGEPNQTYTLQTTGSLSPVISWSNFGSVTANASGDFEYIDPTPLTQRFYRLRLP